MSKFDIKTDRINEYIEREQKAFADAMQSILEKSVNHDALYMALSMQLHKRGIMMTQMQANGWVYVKEIKTSDTQRQFGSINEAVVYAFELLDQQKADSDE